ncbi:hypothetical protein ACFSYG_16810 [Leeuwenhoekiella polynyae]|uniref:Uncharacterized protein n=1 Tax=Leeuwenhoekiella polynyae TaxID=1550906 RepID=A0A4Q0P1Y8_9FLAO|nr:hypothetical protein [Leeuwenhoekiella polynyae]RXG20205.1 hypothetical protein DSM02_2641 [Leeuwenhoekiella polynyae]
MISKSKNIKAALSILLVLAIFAFKVVDIHKYVHDNDSVKGSHCELCLLTHKQKQNLDFDLPPVYDFQLQSPVASYNTPVFYTDFIKINRFPFGISLNKAPPVSV